MKNYCTFLWGSTVPEGFLYKTVLVSIILITKHTCRIKQIIPVLLLYIG